jgi:hypothetical protein
MASDPRPTHARPAPRPAPPFASWPSCLAPAPLSLLSALAGLCGIIMGTLSALPPPAASAGTPSSTRPCRSGPGLCQSGKCGWPIWQIPTHKSCFLWSANLARHLLLSLFFSSFLSFLLPFLVLRHADADCAIVVQQRSEHRH